MEKLSTVLLSSSLLLSFSSVASEDLLTRLIIQFVPSHEGTVVIEGKPKYEKTFKVIVYNKTKQLFELNGFEGCFKEFDTNGREFDQRTVQVDLLGMLKKGTKEGEVSFVSDDEAVYSARFVKWSSQCPNLAKRTQLLTPEHTYMR